MKLNLFSPITPMFKGRREDRNTVNQLKQDNDYALTENNQIKINKAIDNLAKESGEKNVKFLIDVADDLKYGTNIDLGKNAKHDWKTKLHSAAQKSLSMSDPITQQKYTPIMTKVFNTEKPLTKDEKDILKSRESILSRIDKSQLENEKNPNIKRVESNLDYFIASSEVPTKQKKYVLNRLDYFMSPEYKINPQLENKKTIALAEIVNDIVVDTPDSKVPNTKAINQKHHGMCAAISVSRKLMSYEDKPNYVDSLMSELDASPVVMVYDKTDLGKHKRVPVEKVAVDFDDAEKKGYRIVDASVTQWMNIADKYGSDNVSKSDYTPFDRENFGAYQDSHYLIGMDDPKLETKQRYYQALIKSKEVIGSAKKTKIEKFVKIDSNHQNYDKDFSYLQKTNNVIKSTVKQIVPSLSDRDAHDVSSRLIALNLDTAEDIKTKSKFGTEKYHFIPNEENSIKDKKIKSFLVDTFQNKVDIKVLDDNAPKLRELVEDSNNLNKKLAPKSTMSSKVAGERKLFEAAAAYRAHTLISLNDSDYRTDRMIKYNVPDSETLLADNMNKVLNHVEKTGDKKYLNHFAGALEIEPNKEDIVETLKSIKQGVDSTLTQGLDSAYHALGLGSRKDALLNEVSGVKMAIQSGDKQTIADSSFSLGLKGPDKEKSLKAYTKFENVLSNGADEKQYSEIFNKVGYKSQLQSFADAFGIVADAMNDPEDDLNKQIVANFNKANKIPEGQPIQESQKVLQQVAQGFNNLSANITFVRDLLDVHDEKGELINTASPSAVLTKEMEKDGTIIPAKDLVPLRDRFDKLDKLRSQDEFSSRQGKISDPSLYKFSSGEKETLKKIDKSINRMYADTKSETGFVLKEIRKPLEEHARKIGVDKGNFWVSEGSSGLYSEQQAKILEQLTDRKYHVTKDAEKGIDQIKNTPYSGISSTSVFHDRMGAHAQYVAEISPAGKDNKDVFYHDNSWGASELENTWENSDGTTRTDYSDNRGGATGYITNNKWRNGNYVEDMLTKGGEVKSESVENKQLKKFTEDRGGYKFASIMDIVLPGNDGQVKRIAAGMKDNIFVPESAFLNDLDKQASKMTQAQIKARFVAADTAASGYKNIIDNIDKRLYQTPFEKGISTKADYDNLSDKDPIKVNFEKVALTRSFPDGFDWKAFAKVDNVKDIAKFKAERDKTARSYFDYSFGKDDKVLYAYALDKKVNKTFDILNKALDNHNIKLSDDDKISIIKNTAVYEKDEQKQFDGSLKNTIGFMVGKTLKQFDKVVPDSDDAKLAKAEIKENLTKSISEALYINKDDINNKSTKFKALSNYIDEKYNPETDEDFVNVYRNMQDMTTDEFKNVTSDVKPEHLGIKNYTGYDMLVKYKASDEKTENTLRNTIYQHELLNDIELSDTKPSFKYNKLYKHQQGATYANGRTFDDLYRSFNSSAQSLTFDKMFRKNKDDAYRKYGAMPAYPKVSVIDASAMKRKEDMMDDVAFNTMNQIRDKKTSLQAYELVDNIENAISNLPDNEKVSKKQSQSINNMVGEFITMSYNDQVIQKSVNAAMNVLNMGNNAKGADYKNAYQPMKTEFATLKKMNPPEVLKNSIKDDLTLLKQTFNTLLNSDIPERHRNVVKVDLNNWIREELKADYTKPSVSKQLETVSSKMDKYSNGKKSYPVSKKVFIDDLENNVYTLAKTKSALDDNSLQKDAATEKFGLNFKNVLNSVVPEDNKGEFTAALINLTNSDVKLTKESTNKALLGEFEKFSSKSEDELLNDKMFKGLAKSTILLNHGIIADKKYNETYNNTLSNINDMTKSFLDGNIKSEYQTVVGTSIGDVIQTTLSDKGSKYNAEKAMDAHDKFINDYEKYQSLNDPEQLLKDYILLNAKDSPLYSSNPKEAEIAKNNLQIKSGALDAVITNSSLVEMQELLMEATGTGNASSVAEKFDAYSTGLQDPVTGASLTMADNKAIDYMVRMMVVGDNDDTAVAFVNKLGLAEKLLKAEDEIFEPKEAKKGINKIVNILGTTSAQSNVVQAATKNLIDSSFDADENAAGSIDKAKKTIIDKTKKMTRQKNVKTFLSALDSAKSMITANPELPKSLIVAQILNSASSAVAQDVNNDVASIQKELNAISAMHDLIQKLSIPEYSNAHSLREKFNEKFDDLQQYNNEQLAKATNNSSGISITLQKD